MLTQTKPTSLHETVDDVPSLIRWAESFAKAVRDRDVAAGRELFDEDCFSFGTRAAIIDGLDQLVDEQWSPTWNQTRGFSIDLSEIRSEVNGDMAWIAAPWQSQGLDSTGNWFDRFGRATYILSRRHGRWLATHSHHSLNPR